MRQIETETLILGGGWSGLVAANLLSERGSKSVLLERDAELGGLARTFAFKGFKFDVGGHRLFFKKKENLRYLQGLFRSRGLLNLKKKAKFILTVNTSTIPSLFHPCLDWTSDSFLKFYAII